MTKADLTLVYEKAADKNFKIPAYPEVNTECDGIASWTKKRPVTLVGAVSCLRWQAQYIFGGWDSNMLQETLIFLQDKATLISSLSPTGDKKVEVENLLAKHHDHDHDEYCQYQGSGIWNCGTVDQS